MVPDLIREVRTLLVEAAQAELLPRFAEVTRSVKADGSLCTAADTGMQSRVQGELARRWPQYRLLGEEMSHDEQEQVLREGKAGFWCLDPLDGTTNFVNGVPFFSISLALVVGDAPAWAWVYDPLRDECFSAQAGQGVWLNDDRLPYRAQQRPLRQCIAVVDFKRLYGALAARLGLDPPYGSQRSFGSSALEWCWLAAGRYQLYLHGGQKLWDYVAGALILEEMGGHARTLEDQPVFRHALESRSVVAALDPDLFAAWRGWVHLGTRGS